MLAVSDTTSKKVHEYVICFKQTLRYDLCLDLNNERFNIEQ